MSETPCTLYWLFICGSVAFKVCHPMYELVNCLLMLMSISDKHAMKTLKFLPKDLKFGLKILFVLFLILFEGNFSAEILKHWLDFEASDVHVWVSMKGF